jgi:tetratricopeptide (TPR) repeat protein
MDVDTRSDIYSLGVLLYELLTGTTPIDQETIRQAAFDELRRIIREQEPPKPSTRISSLGATRATVSTNRRADARQLDRAVRGELDWIVMKALEKDRRRRYETANDFAADVMRYLTNRPVEACPPSTLYRLRKFGRRNRAALATAVLVILALLSGIAISTWQAIRASEAERKTARALGEARQQRDRADERFRLAFQALYRLRVACRNVQSAAGPRRTAKLQRTIQDDLLRYHTQLLESSADDPEITFEMAESYSFMSRLYPPTEKERSEWARSKALSLFERLAEERPDDTRVLGSLANMLHFRGSNYFRNKEFERAEVDFRRSLDLFERIARTHSDHVYDWYAMFNLGDWGYGEMLRAQGRTAEAEALDRRILAWFERPEFDLSWFDNIGGSRSKGEGYDGFIGLSDLLIRCDQPLKAIPILERARPYLVFDQDYDYYLEVLTKLSHKLVTDPDPAVRARAVSLAREGVELTSRTDAVAWLALGLVLDRTGDREGADEAFNRAGELGRDKALVLNSCAWRLVTDPQPGALALNRAVQMAERAAKLAPQKASFWNTVGVTHYRVGDWKAAIEALKKAEALEPDKYLAFNGFFLAMAQWQLGQTDEARTWYDKAVAWMEKNQPIYEESSRFREELSRFRAEAATLLGVSDLPADVFARP